MKKLLCIILSAALALSLPVFSASAEEDISTRSIEPCDGYFSDWDQTGTARGLDKTDFMEGEGCYSFEGSDMTIGANFTDISCPGGVKNEKYFEFWFYVDDASKLSEECKVLIYKNDIKKYKTAKSPFLNVQNGWNKVVMNLNLVIASVDEVNRIEFVIKASDKVKIKLDDLSFAKTERLSDRTALDAAVAKAEAFDPANLTASEKTAFYKFLDRAKNDVKTQRDADALSESLENYM